MSHRLSENTHCLQDIVNNGQYGSTTTTKQTRSMTNVATKVATTAAATTSTTTTSTTATSRRFVAILVLLSLVMVVMVPFVNTTVTRSNVGSMSIVRQPSSSSSAKTATTKVSVKEQKAKHQDDFAPPKEGNAVVVTADNRLPPPPPPTNSHQAYDLIRNLPGLNYNPGFRQYSGYITLNDNEEIDRKKHMFYWFVESQKSSDPGNDPLVLWTNGGPGCSGLVGFGTEHGPFLFHKNMTLSKNIYSWNTIANMLYIEQPCGVGFSYYSSKANERKTKDKHKHDNDKDDKPDYYTSIGDKQASKDMYSMIRQFLQRFPQYQKNDFYIASESYGGHYMPQCKLRCFAQVYYQCFVWNPFISCPRYLSLKLSFTLSLSYSHFSQSVQ